MFNKKSLKINVFVIITITLLILGLIVPITNSKQIDIITGYDKGPSFTNVVPMKKVTFIDFNKTTLIDDYAYLASVPTAVFKDQEKDRLFSHPLLFYEEKLDYEDDKYRILDTYPGIEYFSREFHRIDPDVRYVVSCFGSDPEEFVKVVRVIDNETKDCTKPVAIELNLSCPHAQKVGMAIGTDPVIVEDVIKSVKKSTSLPVWAKLTPNITDITKIGIAAVNGGVDALVACNTIKALVIDISTKKPILANKRGGLSGSAIKPIAIRAIFDLYELLGSEVSLIGVGGITTWEDIIEYVLAGANAVQIGTTLSYTNSKDLINSLNLPAGWDGPSFAIRVI